MGVNLALPVMCLLFGFVWGFITHMSLSDSHEKEMKAAFQQGYDKRDAEAYRNLHLLVDMQVSQKVSDHEYYLEPVADDRYHVRWCDPVDLKEGWVIKGAVTEWRKGCLSLNMDKAEIKIDRMLAKGGTQ